MEDLHRQAREDCETLIEQLTTVLQSAHGIAQWGCVQDLFRKQLNDIAKQADAAREIIYTAIGR